MRFGNGKHLKFVVCRHKSLEAKTLLDAGLEIIFFIRQEHTSAFLMV